MSSLVTIVIARHKEDVSWADQYENKVIIQKDDDLPNIGREPSSFIYYIIQNYESLKGDYVFVQGNPLDHFPDIHEHLKESFTDFWWLSPVGRTGLVCDMWARPHDFVDIKKFLKAIGVKYLNWTISFNACCGFMISAEQIKKHPLEFYDNLFRVLMEDERSCYAFERCVGLIFDEL